MLRLVIALFLRADEGELAGEEKSCGLSQKPLFHATLLGPTAANHLGEELNVSLQGRDGGKISSAYNIMHIDIVRRSVLDLGHSPGRILEQGKNPVRS